MFQCEEDILAKSTLQKQAVIYRFILKNFELKLKDFKLNLNEIKLNLNEIKLNLNEI